MISTFIPINPCGKAISAFVMALAFLLSQSELQATGHHEFSKKPRMPHNNPSLHRTVELMHQAHNSRIYFEENKGQVKDQNGLSRTDVLYYGQTDNFSFFFQNDGLSYQLFKLKKSNDGFEEYKVNRIDIKWKNYNSAYSIKAVSPLPGYNNFYNVPAGSAPALFVKSYENLSIENLWQGVDVVFYGHEGILKYDWIVSDPESVKNIALEIKGAKVKSDGENLIMETPLGTVKEGALIALQEGRQLPCRWVVNGQTVGIAIENMTPGKPLRIDPPVRLWGTYYGGPVSDGILGCHVDTLTNELFATGRTSSSTAIATSGTHQPTVHTIPDAFLVKFNGSGVRIWGTYYGGPGNDYGLGIATDASGNVYFCGSTFSTSNIASPGAHQETYNGTLWSEGFLVKLNSSGVRLWGTYYGGTHVEDAGDCAVDTDGNVYICGYSQSTSPAEVIATPGSHQPTNGGTQDAYLAKFSPSGVRLWGTYYGGATSDRALSLKYSPDGHLVMCGYTASTSGIASPGAHKTTVGGTDAFLVKFTTDGTRVWGTYVGGPQFEHGNSCAVDAQSNIYLAGQTNSSSGTGVGTPGTFSQFYRGGAYDAYLIKFSPGGTMLWGTFFGATDNEDNGNECFVDKHGGVFLCGFTKGTAGVATTGAFQETFGGVQDAYLARFNVTNGTLFYATYYGGTSTDFGQSCAVDNVGYVYLTGSTLSTTGISTPGAHQTSHGGPAQDDAYIVKFCNELSIFYQDSDNDGYGDASSTVSECFQPSGYVSNSTDCNDGNPMINPGQMEVCLNGIDDNCNGMGDDDCLTQLQGIFCGTTLNAMSQVLVVDSMPGADLYEIRISDGSTTWTLFRPNSGFYLSMIPGLQYSTSYTIDARWTPDGSTWSGWGPPCSVNSPTIIPLLKPEDAVCDITLTSYPLLIKSVTYPINYYWLPSAGGTHYEIYGASQYEFDFLSTSPFHQVTATRTPPSGRNLFLNLGVGLRWAHTYRLRIRSFVPGIGWSDWGDSCNITTPSIPLTQLEPAHCGSTITSITQVFRAIAMHQASEYEFKISDGFSTWTVLRPNRGCYLLLFGPTSWAAGVYTVEVRWKTSYGVWSPWGDPCNLIITTPLNLTAEFSGDKDFDVHAFPNPFSDVINLSIKLNGFDKVYVGCFDVQGRMIDNKIFFVEKEGIYQFGENWANGVYTLRILKGTEVRTLRVIKLSDPH